MRRSWFARAQTMFALIAATVLASCPGTIETTSASHATGATGTGGGSMAGTGGAGGSGAATGEGGAAGAGGELLGPCVAEEAGGAGGGGGALPVSEAVAFQLNARHDGFQPGNGLALPLVKKWSVDLHGSISYPLIAEGRVFVTVGSISDLGATLYALDAHTGAILWEPVFIPADFPGANAVYDRGKVFVATYTGGVRAFDAASGAALWSWQLEPNPTVLPPPTAFAGRLFVGADDTLFGIEASSGKLLWKKVTSWGTRCLPVVDGNAVYCVLDCQHVSAHCPTSGALLWHRELDCYGAGEKAAVLAGDRLYLRAKDEPSKIIDAKSGVDQGTFKSDQPPAFDGVRGFFLSGGELRAEDLASGATLWTFSGDGDTLVSAPIIAGDQVFVGAANGHLHALDVATGAVLWSGKVGGAIHAPAEENVTIPLTGLATAEGVLVVPADHFLVGY